MSIDEEDQVSQPEYNYAMQMAETLCLQVERRKNSFKVLEEGMQAAKEEAARLVK